MTRSRSGTALVAFALALAASHLAGCSKDVKAPASPDAAGHAASTDPDDQPITEADVAMPATLPEAVGRVSGYRDQIRSAIEAGTPSKAHRPLDELDIVLKKLMPLVRDSGISKSEWQDINLSIKSLQDSFNKLHAAIDRNQKPDYAAVEDTVNSAISVLQAAATKLEPAAK